MGHERTQEDTLNKVIKENSLEIKKALHSTK